MSKKYQIAQREVPLKKPVEALAIVPKADKVSVVARKLYNVMMHEAQRLGDAHEVYRMRLRDVAGGIEFTSTNTEALKEHFRKMATTPVEWQSPKAEEGEGGKWGVATMIAQAEITRDERGEVYIEWVYAPAIKRALLDPQRFAKISVSIMATLKTHAGVALYEICARYADVPGSLTTRRPWEWWRPVLTGAAEEGDKYVGAYSEWKIFHRDVLKTAVFEVSEMTEFVVEPVVHKKGRWITDLQFKVTRKSAQNVPMSLGPVSLKSIGRAIQAGISQEKAEKMLHSAGDKKFEAGLDALETRLESRHLPEVQAPDRFMKAILNQAPIELNAGALDSRKTESSELTIRRTQLVESYREHQREAAVGLFEESTDSKKQELLTDFQVNVVSVSGDAVKKSFEQHGVGRPMTKALFKKFLAETMFGVAWDSPNEEELLNFSLRA